MASMTEEIIKKLTKEEISKLCEMKDNGKIDSFFTRLLKIDKRNNPDNYYFNSIRKQKNASKKI